MSQCDYDTGRGRCRRAAEYRVIEAGEEADVCTEHVGPVLSGDSVARVYPLSLTEDGAASNVVQIRSPKIANLLQFRLLVARRAA